MTVIGFLHYRKKPTNKAYAYAAVAKAEGAELLYFSPGAVDFAQRKIDGYQYQSGAWAEVRSDFPDAICYFAKFSKARQQEVVQRLFREIPNTACAIGDKIAVYQNLMRCQAFSQYLIPSEEILSDRQFFDFLNRYGEIVLKPAAGCRGRDVYFVSKAARAHAPPDFLLSKTREEKYLMQPYINCRTKSGNAYDFRLHVQKNEMGEWVISKICPRIAEAGSIVCNISRGGYTADLTAFLKKEFGGDAYSIQKYMEEFSLRLAAHMDALQTERGRKELDELGIDIGLDADQKIRIYEINRRPGHPPSIAPDLNVIKNAVRYSMLLANQGDIK